MDLNPQKLYQTMHLIREAEKAIIREYPNNEIKTPCHLAIGAEAIATGVCHTFPDSKIFGSYRNHHWYLACGGNLNHFFAELYGKENPIADGKAGSMHLSCPQAGLMLTSAVVATQLGPAIGHAFAQSYKRSGTKTIVFLGDGATEEGAFHEAMNLAALYQLPILFVVEDNDLAIHQQKENRQAFKLWDLVKAYEIDYFRAAADSLDRVLSVASRVTKFPTVLHFTYFRFLEHVGVNEDFDAGYREKPRNFDVMDPLKSLSLQECLKSLSEEERREIEKNVQFNILTAIDAAKSAKSPAPEKVVEHIFI
jgi:TPP-dependent pyruvate/acetoin dehydrogenase alpha subunit